MSWPPAPATGKILDMALKRYWFLGLEFLRPRSFGAYTDGEAFHYFPPHPVGPARLYLAVSHGALLFQTIRLPASVPSDKAPAALRLEARRLFSLLRGREPGEISCAAWPLEGNQFLVAFEELSFFRRLEHRLPRGLVLCGVFPAFLALWAFFRAKGPLADGLYLVDTARGYEGFLWEEGRLKGLLPFSPEAAAPLLEAYGDRRFEAPLEALSQGALLLATRFPETKGVFDLYPLRLRPRISKKALALWLLPVFLFLLGQGLEWQGQQLEQEADRLARELAQLKAQEKALNARLEEQKTLEALAREIRSYQERSPLLEALAELARLLPEDSWIRKFEFRAPDTIQLWGESANTLEVIKRLEASPLFREVKVISSVTKNPRTGKENFAIRAHLEKRP